MWWSDVDLPMSFVRSSPTSCGLTGQNGCFFLSPWPASEPRYIESPEFVISFSSDLVFGGCCSSCSACGSSALRIPSAAIGVPFGCCCCAGCLREAASDTKDSLLLIRPCSESTSQSS